MGEAAATRSIVIAGFLFPSPLVGEGGRDAKHRGRVRGLSPRIETPHPARTMSAPPSPTRGEGKKRALHYLKPTESSTMDIKVRDSNGAVLAEGDSVALIN